MAKIVASQLQSLVTRATITPITTPRVAPPQTAFGPFQCNTKSTAATIAIIVLASTVFLVFVYYTTVSEFGFDGVSKRGFRPSFFFLPFLKSLSFSPSAGSLRGDSVEPGQALY
jgi:hypothetical protein